MACSEATFFTQTQIIKAAIKWYGRASFDDQCRAENRLNLEAASRLSRKAEG